MASTLEMWFLFASHVLHAAGTAFLHIPRGVGVMWILIYETTPQCVNCALIMAVLWDRQSLSCVYCTILVSGLVGKPNFFTKSHKQRPPQMDQKLSGKSWVFYKAQNPSKTPLHPHPAGNKNPCLFLSAPFFLILFITYGYLLLKCNFDFTGHGIIFTWNDSYRLSHQWTCPIKYLTGTRTGKIL